MGKARRELSLTWIVQQSLNDACVLTALELAKCCGGTKGRKSAKHHFSLTTSGGRSGRDWEGAKARCTCNDKAPKASCGFQSRAPALSRCVAEIKTKRSWKAFFSLIFKAISVLEIALK